MKLKNISVSLLLSLLTTNCAVMQTSDFQIMVKLPASEVMRFRELTGLDVKEPMVVKLESMEDVLI